MVAVGTELLLGQVVDTNSAWIGEQLALGGIDCFFASKVGDNAERMASVIRLALDRSDAVIVCGGLGPTHDDITREVIAQVMGVELVPDPEIEARIRALFEERGREMPANNLRQALLPVGAAPIAQQLGTAPGLVCPVGSKVIYAVPGVPREMRAMVTGTILGDLASREPRGSVIRSRVVRVWGTSESALAEVLQPRIDELDAQPSEPEASGGPRSTIAFLASGVEGLKVRITAKALTEAEAETALSAEVGVVAGILGPIAFSTHDETMETVVIRLLGERGLTLATAESVTGGLVAARLTAAPGASEFFKGGVVSYASEVKRSVLGVPEGPVVTAEAAEAMAAGACRVLGSDVGVATTGVAGPERQEDVSVGTVFLGLCIQGWTTSQVVRLPGERDQVQQLAAISVLDLLRRHLLAVG